MKLLEWMLNSYIHEKANIDEMQYGFVPGRGTTDGIFVVSQLHKYTTVKYCFISRSSILRKRSIMYQGTSYGGP